MPAPKPVNTPCVLIIRDGWGRNPNPEHDRFNAIHLAKTPVNDRLMRECASTLIRTSGEDVGLPEGTMGNSEVGHQNIGAGRIVDQESVRISKAARTGMFASNDVLVGAVHAAKDGAAAVHLMGIASDAGVHGLLSHLYALLRLCRDMGQKRVYIHLFTDGRDTGPFTGKGYVHQIAKECKEVGAGRIVSVMGRYWAMDRDNRWERVANAYACLTGRGAGHKHVQTADSATGAIQSFYDAPLDPNMKGDEFITRQGAPGVVQSDVAVAAIEFSGQLFMRGKGTR